MHELFLKHLRLTPTHMHTKWKRKCWRQL